MYGKFFLYFMVVLNGQSASGTVFKELKELGDQFDQFVHNSYDTIKGVIATEVSNLKTEDAKLRENISEKSDPQVLERINEMETEIKKQTTEAKAHFKEKVTKPINEEFKDNIMKIPDSVLKATSL